MGVSREIWIQVWTAVVLSILASGLAMVLTAVGLDAASQDSATTWWRIGIATMVIGAVSALALTVGLYVTRPAKTTTRLGRAWRYLRNLRIVSVRPEENSGAVESTLSNPSRYFLPDTRLSLRTIKRRGRPDGDGKYELMLSLLIENTDLDSGVRACRVLCNGVERMSHSDDGEIEYERVLGYVVAELQWDPALTSHVALDFEREALVDVWILRDWDDGLLELATHDWRRRAETKVPFGDYQISLTISAEGRRELNAWVNLVTLPGRRASNGEPVIQWKRSFPFN